jgi:hypothetical protein
MGAAMTTKNKHAVELGRRGGRAKSPRKTAAARANAQKGGRPPDYEIVGDAITGRTARIWKRTDDGLVPATQFSPRVLVSLAIWMKKRRPYDVVTLIDDEGRVYFGREE